MKNLNLLLIGIAAMLYGYIISTIITFYVIMVNLANALSFIGLLGLMTILLSPIVYIVLHFFMDKNKRKNKHDFNLDLLNHAVINQLETDFEVDDLTAIDELIDLIKKENVNILYDYLSESAQKNLKEGLTQKRW